jgi:hypothetical protein
MKIEEYNEEIKDDDEISELLSEEFEAFLEELVKQEDMIRPINEDDGDCENFSFIWTKKACKLIESERDALREIGLKYFPDGDICVESSLFTEP